MTEETAMKECINEEKKREKDHVIAVKQFTKLWQAWWDINDYGNDGWYEYLDLPDCIIDRIEKEWDKLPSFDEILEIVNVIGNLISGSKIPIEDYTVMVDKEFKEKYKEAADEQSEDM